MPKKALKSLIASFRLPAYRFSYYAGATYQYYRHRWLGPAKPEARLGYYKGSSWSSSKEASKRLALFVAYHPGQPVPLSNRDYLEALRQAGFDIIYIHNGPLSEDTIDSLTPLCKKVFCRLNIGQDFGAWKDGYLFARLEGLLDDVQWLLMCNDSNFFLGGERGARFVHLFREELDRASVELIALNKNYELWQHYQSFFLCFGRSLFTRSSFKQFWQAYRPLSHRYHAINNGEIAFTRRILSSVSSRVLYESTGLAVALQSGRLDPDEFFSLLPQNAMYLRNGVGSPRLKLTSFHLQQVMALLDCHNPSHAYALLFVRYLSSPFLKKDLLRQGVCSLPQIAALLASVPLSPDSLLWREIVSTYEMGGRHTSYIRYPREAFRKGINSIQGVVFTGYGDALSFLGIRP